MLIHNKSFDKYCLYLQIYFAFIFVINFLIVISLSFSCCPCELSVNRNLPSNWPCPQCPCVAYKEKGFQLRATAAAALAAFGGSYLCYVSMVVLRVLFNTPAISLALPLSLSQYTLLCVGLSVVLFVLLSIPAIGLRAMLR